MAEFASPPQEIPMPHHERIPQNILGLRAVLEEEKRVLGLLTADAVAESVHDLEVQAALGHVRETVANLPEQVRHVFDDITDEHVPQFFKTSYREWEKDKYKAQVNSSHAKEHLHAVPLGPQWSNWLSNVATDDQLLNFVQWHTARMEALQNDPESQRLIGQTKLGFKSGVKRGIRKGYLDPASEVFNNYVDELPLMITDTADAVVEGAYVAGYAIQGNNNRRGEKGAYIVEPPVDTKLKEEFAEIAFHEMGHLYGDDDVAWMREAIDEHFAQGLLFNDWEVIDPARRLLDKQRYGGYRTLLAAVTGDGKSEQSQDLIKSILWRFGSQTQGAYDRADANMRSQLHDIYGSSEVFEALTLQIEREIAWQRAQGSTKPDHTIGQQIAAKLAQEWKDPELRAEIIEAYEGYKQYQEAQLKETLDESWI